MNKDNEKIIKALENFNKAYHELLIEWNKNDILDRLESIEYYPFEGYSFDELGVERWVEKSLTELKEV